MNDFPCCKHCTPEPDTGKCWAVDCGHGCSCRDCPEKTSDDYSFDWAGLGVDESGLPIHLPMGVNAQGQGPEDQEKAHHWACWCQDPGCPLTYALSLARGAAIREARS